MPTASLWNDNDPIRITTGCKINLFLRIVGICNAPPYKGWHELDTIFLPLPEPYDTLLLRPHHGLGLHIDCAEKAIDPRNNTLTKAYESYAKATGFSPSLHIELIKGIPHGAGLGGGSADAAALLGWLNAAAPKPLSKADLQKLAVDVGADVPFFLLNTPCHATGLGQNLVPVELSWLQGLYLVLACPNCKVSTPWAYGAYDEAMGIGGSLDTEKDDRVFTKNLTERNQWAISFFVPEQDWMWIENSFEKVVFYRHPELAKYKAILLQGKAVAASMTGSGSALFGLFRSEHDANCAAQALQDRGVATYCHLFTTAR